MMKQLKNSLLVSLLVLTVTAVQAQESGTVIKIPGVAEREIPDSKRMPDSPKIIDTVFPVPNTRFPLLAMNYEPYFEIQPIAPATVNVVPKLPQLYNGYAKIGIGSVMMPLAEVYYNNTRTRKFNYGVHAQHLSSFGRMKDLPPANFDRTNLRAFGGMNEKKYDWNAEFNYNNRGLHWYGFQNVNANADSIAQRFQTAGLKSHYASHKHDSLGVNWKVGVEYRHFNDKKPFYDSLADWRSRENYLAVGGGASFKWGTELFRADADLKYNGYRYGIQDSVLSVADSGIVNDNVLFSLRPSITTYSHDKRLKAQIGFDLTVNGGANTKAYLYPVVEAKYSLFNDILIPYGGLRGGMKQVTYKSLTDVNEFMLSGVQLRNEHKSIEGYAGIKGTLSRRVGFNFVASFGNIKDKALFITDTLASGGNRFRVIYDSLNVAQIEGSLTYQLLEKTKIDLLGRYYSYSLKNNSYAWNLPQMQFIIRATHNLYDKFVFNVDVNLEGGRKALVYVQEAGVTEEDGQLAKSLGFIADANIGVEYRYNTRVSAFLNMNNVAAQRYKRWYNYPVQGFQVMGGVTVRF